MMPRWLPFLGAAILWVAVGPAAFAAVLVGVVGAATALISLGPSVLADPPAVLRLGRPIPPPADDAVAFFRAIDGKGIEGSEERSTAARTALKVRFPRGTDAAALVAFLTADGPDRSASCQREVHDGIGRYYCRISYGSLAATMLGLARWRGGEWAVGVTLAGQSEAIERVSAGNPLFGK